MIDLCIVATLRPELLGETLRTFNNKIKYSGIINIIINIDYVPKNSQIASSLIADNMYYHILAFKDNMLSENKLRFNQENEEAKILQGKGNFAKAVKTVWENTTSDYVFHLEDDWKFLKEIDLDWCIEDMKCNNYDYLRFPKIHAAHLNCMYKVALQPSLWKGDVVRAIAKEMKIDKDPEKQLRTGQGNEPLDKILFELQKKGLKDYDFNCCNDIGREWRDSRGLKKWNAVEPNKVTNDNQNAKNITWWK